MLILKFIPKRIKEKIIEKYNPKHLPTIRKWGDRKFKEKDILTPFQENLVQLPGRRVGNTTRIVDMCVNLLLSGAPVVMVDHFGSTQSNDRLSRLVLRRLKDEHDIDYHKVTRSWIDQRTVFYIRQK